MLQDNQNNRSSQWQFFKSCELKRSIFNAFFQVIFSSWCRVWQNFRTNLKNFLLWFSFISTLIVVDFFFVLCVFTFLFYKHLLLFFLLREMLRWLAFQFRLFLLFLQCRFCLLLALQKKKFLLVVYYLRLCLSIFSFCACIFSQDIAVVFAFAFKNVYEWRWWNIIYHSCILLEGCV